MMKRYPKRGNLSKSAAYLLGETAGDVQEIMREHRELIPEFEKLDENFREFSMGSVIPVRYNTYF
jgi:hypothetical protein